MKPATACLALLFCVNTAMAQDTDIDDILQGTSQDVTSLQSLTEALETSDDAELEVLFRKIGGVSDKRPDLVDHVIAKGLASSNPVLRHQGLWALINRAQTLSIVVDPKKSDASTNTIRGTTGLVIPLALFEKLPARRSASLVQAENSKGEQRVLQVIGDNVHFRTYADDDSWSMHGVLALSEDGKMLVGNIDFWRPGYNTASMYGTIQLQ